MKKLTLLFLLSAIVHSCVIKEGPENEISSIENSLSYHVQVKNRQETFSIPERMKQYQVPGVSIAVVRDGKLHWTKAYGMANTETGKKVTTETLFQAGSISKPIAALAVLKLADEGKINLEEDVNSYLKDWQIPQNEFNKEEKVTVRRLLTHTAGLNVMGFPGYSQDEYFPTSQEVLNGKGHTPALTNDTIPGSRWMYSGGGYTVLQMMVEDVSGMPFEDYLQLNILEPMEMNSSTYEQPLPEKLHSKASAAYDKEGNILNGYWHNYPEKAAAGLWTTPEDLAMYAIEIQKILRGKDGVLSQEMTREMLTKHQFSWGLGPQLQKKGDSLIFQHSGKNAGFTNNFIAFANQGNAIVVMTNGDNGGVLMQEVVRSISEFYHWGIAKTKKVEMVSIPAENLMDLTGTYQWTTNPSEEPILLEVRFQKGNLRLFDCDSEEAKEIVPVADSRFIELQTGNELNFSKEGEATAFVLNDRKRYEKIQ